MSTVVSEEALRALCSLGVRGAKSKALSKGGRESKVGLKKISSIGPDYVIKELDKLIFAGPTKNLEKLAKL